MIPSLDWFNYVERKLMFYVYMWLFVYIRAVVFRLFQKTVILPPNPVGFRLL